MRFATPLPCYRVLVQRITLSACLLFLILFFPVPMHGQIDATISRPPRFWTGTSNGFSGVITTITPGTYLLWAELRINEETVKFMVPTQEDPWPIAWEGTVVFDSTHFPDGTPVTVRITAMNNQNEVDSGQFKVTASTYNRIYTVGNDNFFVGTANFGKEAIYQVDPELPPINHALLPPERNATPFHQYKGNISSEIPKATVFYAYTHGQNAKLGDSSANAAYEAGKWLTDAEIETAVNQKTVDQPAYNLVVLMACHCGDTETLAAKFKVNALPNVAFLGWNSLIKDEKNTADWAQHLFNRLAAGDVLHDAIGRANDWNQDGLADESVKNGSGGNAAPIVVGDRFRYKLHGVFQGAGTQWYR